MTVLLSADRLMLPQSSVLCHCVFWPEGTLQGNPSGSDIHLFYLEIWAFKIFSVMFIQLCSYKRDEVPQ